MNVVIGLWNEFFHHEKLIMLGLFAEMTFLAIAIFLQLNTLVALAVFFGSSLALIRYGHKIWLADQHKQQCLTQYLQEQLQDTN